MNQTRDKKPNSATWKRDNMRIRPNSRYPRETCPINSLILGSMNFVRRGPKIEWVFDNGPWNKEAHELES